LEIFVGIDWAEAHDDICVLDASGGMVAKRRIAEGLEGVGQLHALLADHATESNQVVVGIETDRGLLVGALLAAGYQVYAINPLAASRYRDRHTTSGAKSDPGDAKVLADLVRTDRHNHRPVAGDSELAASLQVLARAQQNLIWSRQRLVNQLRNNLREYYPAALAAFGTELAAAVALGVLDAAPTPAMGRTLSRTKLVAILRRAGRERRLEETAAVIQTQLRAPQLAAPSLVSEAYGKSVASTVRILRDLNAELAILETELAPPVLRSTRTPRSTAVFPDLASSSAPGFYPSSATTEPASPILKRERTTRAVRPSPRPRAHAGWSWPAWRATGGSLMPATNGPFAP